MAPGLRVAVDARPLDIEGFRTQGIGRYAHGLIGPLREVAAERGGAVVLLRERADATPLAYAGDPTAGAAQVRVRRPAVPGRFADWPEQVLLPLDLRRTGAGLAHSLSIYRSALFPGLPAVMTIHDVIPLMWPERYLKTGLGHRMLYRAARRADLLLAVSEVVRRDTIAYLGVTAERVVTVPSAVDPRFHPVQASSEQPYLLYVGAADPRKGLEGLVDAYARWRREEDRTELLVLAGRESEAGRALAERAERAGAPVRVTGFVDDEELPALYSGARCLVTASRHEGFGLPALEAISCGTPVVAYDTGAIREVAGPGALTVPDGDAPALMRAVARICDEPDLRAHLSAEGLRYAQRYSWRRTAELTWEAYERVAAAAQSGGTRP